MKKFYSMKELGEILPIGVTNLYRLVHSDNFPAIMINRRIVIPADEFEIWVKKYTGKKIITK